MSEDDMDGRVCAAAGLRGVVTDGHAFAPVLTLADLDSLDGADILEGYLSAERGDPEPGPNRGRAFWFGWCNRQRDYGVLPVTAQHVALARALVQRRREKLK